MLNFALSNWDWISALAGGHASAWWVLPWIGRAVKAGWTAVTTTK